MNRSVVAYVLSTVVFLLGVFLLFPTVVALIYGEEQGQFYFGVSLFCLIVGGVGIIKKPSNMVFHLKEGCVVTGLSWIMLSVIGSIPLWASGEIPQFVDALFETVSGFTTTGSSILNNVEKLSRTANFWRCFTHLIGGMGVLLFLLIVLPMGGGSNMNLLKAESTGPSVGKLVPKLRQTARILYLIYLGLFVAEFVALKISGLGNFAAITTAMSNAGTGGFCISNDSVATFPTASKWIIGVFMVLFSVNFNVYYLLLFRSVKESILCEEARVYLLMLLGSATLITISLLKTGMFFGKAAADATFHVVSIASSTGFAMSDFAKWPMTAQMVLMVLMFTGGCAGSTSGGFKISRVMILLKMVRREFISYVHPRSVSVIRLERQMVSENTIRSVSVYFAAFVIILVFSVAALSMEDISLETLFTSVLASLNNIGPGLDAVGPNCDYSFFTPLSKIILMIDMLAGRLELFPILMLFHPEILSKAFGKSNKRITL